jgi:hypothetical protein
VVLVHWREPSDTSPATRAQRRGEVSSSRSYHTRLALGIALLDTRRSAHARDARARRGHADSFKQHARDGRGGRAERVPSVQI